MDNESQDPVPQEARRSLRAFYSIASSDDATWMNTLVLAHVALTQGTNIGRDVLSDTKRPNRESSSDKAEEYYRQARERVRGCRTFQTLVSDDQARIATTLFKLYPPKE